MNNPKSPFLEPRTLVIIGVICIILVAIFLGVGKEALQRAVDQAISANKDST